MLNFLRDMKVLRVANAAAAAQTDIVTSVVDTRGYDSVAFIAALGDVTDASVLGLTVSTNNADSTIGATETKAKAEHTADPSDADNNLLVVDVNKPRQRYAFATLSRGTADAVVDGIFAVLYNSNERPVEIDATVVASGFFNDPADA